MHSGLSASLQDSLSANTPEGGLEPAMRPTWATASKSARMRAMALCMAGHQRLGEFSPLRVSSACPICDPEPVTESYEDF